MIDNSLRRGALSANPEPLPYNGGIVGDGEVTEGVSRAIYLREDQPDETGQPSYRYLAPTRSAAALADIVQNRYGKKEKRTRGWCAHNTIQSFCNRITQLFRPNGSRSEEDPEEFIPLDGHSDTMYLMDDLDEKDLEILLNSGDYSEPAFVSVPQARKPGSSTHTFAGVEKPAGKHKPGQAQSKPQTSPSWVEAFTDRTVLSSKLIGSTNGHKWSDVQDLRGVFRDLAEVQVRKDPAHPHPDSAHVRARANNLIRTFANESGLRPYYISMSNQNIKRGEFGRHVYYEFKDLNRPIRNDKRQPNDINVLVDADYYHDMPKLLATDVRPTLIYTIIPEGVSHSGTDYQFCFQGNEIDMKVRGGARYKHQLWDYMHDTIVVESGFVPFMGYHKVAYLVETKRLAKHRALVLLVPICNFSYPACLSAPTLTRLEISTNGWNILNHYNGGEQSTSLSRDGCLETVTIPTRILETLQTAYSTSNKIERASVESYLPDREESRAASALLHNFLRSETPMPRRVVQATFGVASYQFNPRTYNESAKQKLKAFMSPLLGPCPAPDCSLNNDRRCIEERVQKLQAKVPKKLNSTVIGYATKFAEALITGPELVPVDHSKVWKTQRRPAQQHKLQQSSDCGDYPKRTVSAMQKAEAYANCNDPRNISIVPSDYKERWSVFTLAFADKMKTWQCYAFGKPPRQIAVNISRICYGAQWVLLTDFSRFDGTINVRLRHMEQTVLTKAFKRCYHDELRKLYTEMRNRRGYTQFGLVYDLGSSRLSGDPETSSMNTLVTMFTFFIACIYMGMSIDDAAHRVLNNSMVGGDDGIMADVDKSCFERACKTLGLNGKAEIVRRGEFGVNFLARYYSPDVWYDDPRSVTDIKRAVWKFHTSGNLPDSCTPYRKLYAKARSIIVNDRHTPILGDLCARALTILEKEGHERDLRITEAERTDVNYAVRIWGSANSYPQGGDMSWAFQLVDQQIPTFKWDRFYDWLDQSTYENILNPPLMVDEPVDIPVKADVVVNGEVVAKKEERKEPEKKRKRRRNRRKKRKPPENDNVDDSPTEEPLTQQGNQPEAPTKKKRRRRKRNRNRSKARVDENWEKINTMTSNLKSPDVLTVQRTKQKVWKPKFRTESLS
jgi:hypothetical protein